MYQHTVQYYETDKMGVTHHSNYIRWMEEARIAFLKQIGFGYDKLEAEGIISPVVSVHCDYKQTSTFADIISIEVHVTEFKGVKLVISYEMKNEAGALVCQAESSHCFLDAKGMPVRLKKEHPEFYQALMEQLEQKENV